MDIFDVKSFLDLEFVSEENLRKHGFLSGLQAGDLCPQQCGGRLGEVRTNLLRCKKRICRRAVSTKKSSFFQDSNLSYLMILRLVYLWCCNTTVQSVKGILPVNERSIIHWFKKCRDLCALINGESLDTFKFGGPGVIVQVDESVITKRKYERGKYVPCQWIFGIVDTQSRTGYITFVNRRTADTLLPIIQAKVLPGSIIHSDKFRAYCRLSELGYTHKTVNHSRHFLDPVTKVHTNLIEAYWSAVKQFLRRQGGNKLRRDRIPAYLEEYLWRERYAVTRKYFLKNKNINRSIAFNRKFRVEPWFRRSPDHRMAWTSFLQHVRETHRVGG